MNTPNPNKYNKHLKYTPWVIIVGLLIVGTFGGVDYYKQSKTVERLDSINKEHKKKEKALQKIIDTEPKYRVNIDSIINKYQSQADWANQRARNAENKLKAIRNLVFNKRELDSFADKANYNKSGFLQ